MNSRLSGATPVIIGAADVIDRSKVPEDHREPLALMQQALSDAAADAGGVDLSGIDSLDVVAEHSWPYADAPADLARGMGAAPAWATYGEVGGESPVRMLHEAALRIARRESAFAAIVGAESAYSVAEARKAGRTLPWSVRARDPRRVRVEDIVNPLAVQHGVDIPIHVYPFYENAACAAWGQTPREARQESADIWAEFSRVAAATPAAWIRTAFTPEQIAEVSPGNRLIAWPYAKHMIANNMVNQGAALLLASREQARAMGVPESRMVHLWGGAAANEPRDYLQRDQFVHSHAQDAVLGRALEIVGGDATTFDCIETYSCFPCVPKMARRALRIGPEKPLTVIGGLSFYGAPFNGYMLQAAVGMVRRLRTLRGARGLLYGQGEYVTKHHALVLASVEGARPLEVDYRVDDAADRVRGAVPWLLQDYVGPARVETFTVVYGRDGAPSFGAVIGRTPADERILARVPAFDAASIARLTDLDASPVGSPGQVFVGDDGLLRWSVSVW